ncbi:serine/threonine-protein kinase haspin-like [Mytilus californianus]|uniref:serine/threonine-protein kinase haspin-like n=1 Tax=Mytilus californianus TaxID=6549 RepID=UPI00224557A9|nr:serine/threonine-protein kinase haspin-like [Mytilus californianus]XP_052101866.1 serine/threonine-protein kinase haspin-like [Mytilus californianus]
MGRERKVKTYSRHHGSRVVTVDKELWESSGDEQQKHLFSLSSSSINTSDDIKKDGVFKKNSSNKENGYTRQKRRILPRKRYGSEMDSTGSTGNESLFKTHRPKRALRDRSNLSNQKSNAVTGKRKRQPKSPAVTKTVVQKSNFSCNFSEFDDYSLCISGSPPKGTNKDKPEPNHSSSNQTNVKSSNIIETSTPLAKRTRSYVSFSKDDTDSCTDISYIDAIEDSPSTCSELGISSMIDSPVLVHSARNSKSEKVTSEKDDKISPVVDCQIQLKKLRTSLLLMHISGRRGRKYSISSNFDQSASLFSNISDIEQDKNEKDESINEEVSEYFPEEEEESEESNEENENLSDIDEDEEDDDDEEESSSTDNTRENDENGSTDNTNENSKSRNSTRYMLNDDCCLSEYDTAHSTASDHSYHTAQDTSGRQSLDGVSSSSYKMLKTPNATPVLQNKSIGNLKSLNESLIVMLTPVKKKDQPKVVMSPMSKVFQICQQDEPMSFQSCIPPSMMKICKKVGEGVYGEVFRTQNSGQSVALKVIPIEGDFEVNDEPQKTFEGMLPEIVISKELSLLRTSKDSQTDNFCEVNSVSCVKGKYPRELLKQWDMFHTEKESQNDRPDVFTDQQLFIVFEFADGGKDVESAKFHNIFEAKSVLVQVAFSLAVAEESLQFEHRDLHWGNVLVQKTKKTHLKYKLMGQLYKLECHNIHVSIIDFTLSRLHTEGVTTYNDLSTDDTLFEGTGDYQFEIYRKMKEENGNNWEKFNPKSNVWWLHYLTDKFVKCKRYSRNTKEDQNMFRQLRLFMKDIPNYSSACELVTCSEFLYS